MASVLTEYDPHLHRAEHLPRPINTSDTIIHLFKAYLGTGILTLPHFFKFSGMLSAIIDFVVFSFISTACIHILVKSQYVLSQRRRTGLLVYADTVECACEVGPNCVRKLGKVGSIITNVLLVFHQIIVCSLYWLFIATSLKQILDVYNTDYPLYAYTLVLILPFCLVMCIRNLKSLAPFALAANVISVVSFIGLFYYFASSINRSTFKIRDMSEEWTKPTYLSFMHVVLYALQSLPVVTTIENNMETPEKFLKLCGPLNFSLLIVSCIYLLVGVLGQLAYGAVVMRNVFSNLPSEDIFAEVIISLYCFAIYISYNLSAYVPITIIYRTCLENRLDDSVTTKQRLLLELLLRLSLAVITCLIATLVPFLDLVIICVSGFCLNILGIILPALIQICVYWEERKSRINTFLFWRNMCLVLIGIMGIIFSCLESVWLITQRTEDDKEAINLW